MIVFLKPLRIQDAEAVVAAEDHLTVRWFSGGVSTVAGTRAYVERLISAAEQGSTKRAFGIWVEGAWADSTGRCNTLIMEVCDGKTISMGAAVHWPVSNEVPRGSVASSGN